MECETMRIMKLTNKDGLHPLKFIVPRKSDAFQDDIFPPAASATPAHSCAEWFQGSSKAPLTMKLDPKSMSSNGGPASPKKAAFKTVPILSKEVASLKKHVQYLEGKLTEAGVAFDPFSG